MMLEIILASLLGIIVGIGLVFVVFCCLIGWFLIKIVEVANAQ